MKVAWAIWSEVGDLDRYPSEEEVSVIADLAAEVNGVHFRLPYAEMVRRMQDNYFYPYEDYVAQQRAYMFLPGAWTSMSYVDKRASAQRLAALPINIRFGLMSVYDESHKDMSDQRSANFAALSKEEQHTIQHVIARWGKEA
jgi:hypothetical protein